jgi:hypothetical protein
MKLFYPLVTVLLVYVAYSRVKKTTVEHAPEQIATEQSAAADVLPERTSWKRSELSMVRGEVVAILPEGPVVFASSRNKIDNSGLAVHSNDGNRLARIEAQNDFSDYGPKLGNQGGSLASTGPATLPSEDAFGPLLLLGHPEARHFKGEKLKVTAARMNRRTTFTDGDGRVTSIPIYTMRYTLENPGTLLDNQTSPLNRKPY